MSRKDLFGPLPLAGTSGASLEAEVRNSIAAKVSSEWVIRMLMLVPHRCAVWVLFSISGMELTASGDLYKYVCISVTYFSFEQYVTMAVFLSFVILSSSIDGWSI